MKSLLLLVGTISVSGFAVVAWDEIEIRWTAWKLERQAVSQLKEVHAENYDGIVSGAVWIDLGGLKKFTRVSREGSTFREYGWLEADCGNCFLFSEQAIILQSGRGRRNEAIPFREGMEQRGFLTLVRSIEFGALCERERKIFGGGCRSIVAVAVGYRNLE